MFKVGEKVVYPVHGAGVIESIEQQEVLGETRSYYVLKLSTGGLKVLVPVDGVEHAGLRSICSCTVLEEVRQILCADPGPWEDNWNRRYRTNMVRSKAVILKNRRSSAQLDPARYGQGVILRGKENARQCQKDPHLRNRSSEIYHP